MTVRSSAEEGANPRSSWHIRPTRPQSTARTARKTTAMTTGDLAQALQRAQSVLRRRPEMGLHDDAPATARWQHGTRTVASHANGMQMTTDMPGELGGSGDQVTPGW